MLIHHNNIRNEETDKKLQSLIHHNDKRQAKTDEQLRFLINYNSNRDEELEMIIEDALIKKLKDAGWSVSNVDFTEIFHPDGRKLLEWDGILQCKHEKSQKEILIVIETKQVVTAEKFNKFQRRLIKMKKVIEKASVDDDLFPYKEFLLCGVIAGPVIREDVDTSGFTNITLKQDQYYVNLEPTIFNITDL
jgi:hypothetical protein